MHRDGVALRFSWRSNEYLRQLEGQCPDLSERSELKTLHACYGVIRAFATASYRKRFPPHNSASRDSTLHLILDGFRSLASWRAPLLYRMSHHIKGPFVFPMIDT